MHSINTVHNSDLHMSNAVLLKFKKVVYCTGIKLFINISSAIKFLNQSVEQLRLSLKYCVFSLSCSVEEFNLLRNEDL
jgi:multidrug transporter EmrE-like cation transporter